MDWIGCKYRHTSWIGLDEVSEFVDWLGMDLTKSPTLRARSLIRDLRHQE